MNKMRSSAKKQKSLKKKIRNPGTQERNDCTEIFNREFQQSDERISELEDKSSEIFQSEDQEEKKKKSEESIRDLCNTIKGSIIDIMGIPEREEREKKGK